MNSIHYTVQHVSITLTVAIPVHYSAQSFDAAHKVSQWAEVGERGEDICHTNCHAQLKHLYNMAHSSLEIHTAVG